MEYQDLQKTLKYEEKRKGKIALGITLFLLSPFIAIAGLIAWAIISS